MTLFFVSAAVLVVLSLAFLLAGLFGTKNRPLDQEAVNITLARERRNTLDVALADGSIDQNSYDYERSQLEYDLAADLRLDSKNNPSKKGHIGAAILVAVFIPISAGALYLHLGNPAAITHDRTAAINSTGVAQADASAQSGQQAPSLAEILPNLEARLAASPDDVDGWRLLGRSYFSINDFGKAITAFEKAIALDDNDVPTLAQLAESLAMLNNGDLAGEATDLLMRANKLDANNEHALWLLSIARQQAGDHDTALAGFNRLANMSADSPEALATIEQMRSLSMRELALNNDSALSRQNPNDSVPATTSAENGGAALSVNVDITPEARAAVDAGHAVFIYAKASKGPPMPLAVSRHTVGELPLSIQLDDSMAMIPAMTLSAFPQIIVGARISPSGNAIAQSGDWFMETGEVTQDNAGTLSLVINQQVP